MSLEEMPVAGRDAVRLKMRQHRIYEKDLSEQFVRSPGKGGQNVNKVSTCVLLRHEPTGVTVKCHEARTQGANRVRARELLVERIVERRREAQAAIVALREKHRRQRRKRSVAGKERMLEGKRQKSEVKQRRRKIDLRRAERYL